MLFVYVHVVWFTCWIGFGVEKYPYGLLTMIVSLEAIFLSTFVLISQNRADAKRQVIADEHLEVGGRGERAARRAAQALESDPRAHPRGPGPGLRGREAGALRLSGLSGLQQPPKS